MTKTEIRDKCAALWDALTHEDDDRSRLLAMELLGQLLADVHTIADWAKKDLRRRDL